MAKRYKRPKRFTLRWFFNFFKSIPEESWGTGELDSGAGKYCALGHLAHKLKYKDGYHNPAKMALDSFIKKYSRGKRHGIIGINDGGYNNPKRRVVNYVKKIMESNNK